MEMAKHKKCTKCNVEKEDAEFYWHTKGVRRRAECKKCHAVVRKKYAATEAGKASRKKADKKYFGTEKGKATKKKSSRKYAGTAAGKVVAKKASKKHAGTAKGKATIARKDAKRRSKIEGIINDLTEKQWSQILKYQDYKCNGCKEPFTDAKTATKDHIIPVDKDGGLTKENIQALCQSCNSTKNTYSMAFLINRLKEYHKNCQYVLQGLGI